MEYCWLIIGGICALVGLFGAFIPILPGPPISYITLWMMWLYDKDEVSIATLLIAGVIMIIITILDYIAPIWFAKKGGGSRYGNWGATFGLIIGLFLGPSGIIFGPFLGALIGELINNTPTHIALKVAFMSFLAFILTTGIKLIYGIAILIAFITCLF